jgi:putative DNA primase/helicase
VIRAQRKDPKAFAGIGFTVTKDDPYCAIDIDNCLDNTRQLKPWARSITKRFSDTYTEITPSGKGLRIWTRGKLPGSGRKFPYSDGRIEVYDQGRYFAVTGRPFNGVRRITGHQSDIQWLCGLPGMKNGRPKSKVADFSTIEVIPEGERHNYLMRFAAQLRAKGMEGAEILAALEAVNAERCSPPKSDSEVQRIVEWTTQKPQSFNLTDVGNAERFAAQHGHNTVWCGPHKSFYVYDGRRWRRDEKLAVVQKAQDTVRSIYAVAAGVSDEKLRTAMVDHARRSESHQRIEALLKQARSMLAITPEEFDRNPWLLNVENGTLDLRTAKLQQHDPGDWITKLAPVSYDPTAKCPIWKSFLKRVLKEDEETIRFLQRAVGYAFSGDVSERILFVFHGEGANGKTTLLETIRALLGDYAGQILIEALMQKKYTDGGQATPDIADLRALRFVTSSETAEGLRLNEGKIKYLTGMGTVKARYLHANLFEFAPTFKFFLDCNYRPVIREEAEAIWDRIREIPFQVRIPEEERDKQLLDKLKTELPGILAWVVRGCLVWQREGLGMPSAVKRATEAYREEMDPVGQFLDERCVLEKTARVKADELHRVFMDWCRDNGEEALSRNSFGRRLTQHGVRRKRTDKGTIYKGVSVRWD